jgi:hypothetical protein
MSFLLKLQATLNVVPVETTGNTNSVYVVFHFAESRREDIGACSSVVLLKHYATSERSRVRDPMRQMVLSICPILLAAIGLGIYSACN